MEDQTTSPSQRLRSSNTSTHAYIMQRAAISHDSLNQLPMIRVIMRMMYDMIVVDFSIACSWPLIFVGKHVSCVVVMWTPLLEAIIDVS